VATFTRADLAALQHVAARIIDTRDLESAPDRLARALLAGFSEVCLRAGLDGVLDEHGLTDDPEASERPELRAALADRLGTKEAFDPGGPRNAKPTQLAECVLVALGRDVAPDPARLSLTSELRDQLRAALTHVLDEALAVPRFRDDVVAWARPRCEPHRAAFAKIVAQLDDTGLRLLRQPKVPIHAAQAVQLALAEGRHAVIVQAVSAALDRARPLLAAASPEVAARVDQPISLRLTARDVVCARAAEPRAPRTGAALAQVVLDDLAELTHLAWLAPVVTSRPYSPRVIYAIGDVLEHPTFGRGTVATVALQRVGVDFPNGTVTLVHARA
jgi:hypothetical protein